MFKAIIFTLGISSQFLVAIQNQIAIPLDDRMISGKIVNGIRSVSRGQNAANHCREANMTRFSVIAFSIATRRKNRRAHLEAKWHFTFHFRIRKFLRTLIKPSDNRHRALGSLKSPILVTGEV